MACHVCRGVFRHSVVFLDTPLSFMSRLSIDVLSPLNAGLLINTRVNAVFVINTGSIINAGGCVTK